MLVNLFRGGIFADHNKDFAVLAVSGGGAVAAADAVHPIPVVQEAEGIAAEAHLFAQDLFHVLLRAADEIHAFLDLDVVAGLVGAGEQIGDRIVQVLRGNRLFRLGLVPRIGDPIPVGAVVHMNGGQLVAIGPLDAGAGHIVRETVTAAIRMLLALISFLSNVVL